MKIAAPRLALLAALSLGALLACSPDDSSGAGADAGPPRDAGASDSDAGADDAGAAGDAGSADAGAGDAGANDAGGITDAGLGALGSDGGATTHLLLFGGLAYDPDAGGMSNSPGAFLGDTWIWDGSAWTQLAVQGPPGRWGSIGGVLGGRAMIFGGTGAGSALLGDTWIFDGSAWTQAQLDAGPSPRAIAQGGVLGGRFVLYGGYDIGNDLWSWDGASWTQRQAATLDGPAPAVGLANSVFGGALFLTEGALAWSCDGAQVSALDDGGTLSGPSARVDARAATLGGRVVMWGGEATRDDAPLDETWLWDGGAWAQAGGTQPPFDQSPAGMAALGDKVVLLAGTAPDGGAPVLQMWSFDGAAWTLADVAAPPYRSQSVLLAY